MSGSDTEEWTGDRTQNNGPVVAAEPAAEVVVGAHCGIEILSDMIRQVLSESDSSQIDLPIFDENDPDLHIDTEPWQQEEGGNDEASSLSDSEQEGGNEFIDPQLVGLVEEEISPEAKLYSDIVYPDHPFAKSWLMPLYCFTFPYFHSSTLVSTASEDVSISELKSGDFALDAAGEPVEIKYVFKIQPKVDYLRFARGSLQHKEPNREPAFDLYVSPSAWFLYRHQKAMDCENIMNGNSISRTTISMPADVFLICTEKGDYVRCGRVELATIPWSDMAFWLYNNPTAKDFIMAHRPTAEEAWTVFKH